LLAGLSGGYCTALRIDRRARVRDRTFVVTASAERERRHERKTYDERPRMGPLRRNRESIDSGFG
jgi:hypothetical protein